MTTRFMHWSNGTGTAAFPRRLLGLQLKKLYEGLAHETAPCFSGVMRKTGTIACFTTNKAADAVQSCTLMSVKDEDRRGGLTARRQQAAAYISKARAETWPRIISVNATWWCPSRLGKSKKRCWKRAQGPDYVQNGAPQGKEREYYLLVSVAVNTTERIPGRTTLGIVTRHFMRGALYGDETGRARRFWSANL